MNKETRPLTHFNEQGRARMVDVSGKPETHRTAVARAIMELSAETLQAIKDGTVGKGDVLAGAQVAGVMAAKPTSAWIPMCHPLALAGVNVRFSDTALDRLEI